mmetsp:Transcript_31354/g.63725  ORF Transcript_31354/g.63725 Transcript_31354/m.63725 type:complete len:641 (+) Transcript_31354:113-2035(+)
MTVAETSTNSIAVNTPSLPVAYPVSSPSSTQNQYHETSRNIRQDGSQNSRQVTYRGGFSTSICDIFRNPARRTDCCAVACCGVLSSDRTRYLLTGERPPPLWKRVAMYLIVPAIFISAMNYFAVEVPLPAGNDDSSSSSYNPYGGNSNGESESGQKTTKVAPPALVISFFVYIIILFARGRREKRKIRQDIMAKIYIERARERGEEVDALQLQQFIQSYSWDTWAAHRRYSCYRHDYEYGADGVMVVGPDVDHEGQVIEQDFCSRLWDCLSKAFFGACCSCWCQCCGICALAQEEREINRLTRNEDHIMDYITFQPYSEYFPSIQNLRDNQITSPWQHAKAISLLSVKLLKNVAAVLIVLLLFALTDINSNFKFSNMLVLLFTLGQAFFIEYWVHWRWNRFHLSFDSVVKYFACGFLLTTPMAIAFEAVISTFTGLIVMVVTIFVLASDDDMTEEFVSQDKRTMKDFMVKHQAVFVFATFLNAFLVAAMVEEMVKYFGYWMVVVPDLLPENYRQPDTDTENDDGNEANQNDTSSSNNTATGRHTSAKTTGIGITVAMVSVALGFACCENIIYVFIYSPPSLGVGKKLIRVGLYFLWTLTTRLDLNFSLFSHFTSRNINPCREILIPSASLVCRHSEYWSM